MTPTFSDLALPRTLLDTLDRQGVTAPFPVQAEAIPPILDGHDVSGHAPTGSGKTLAFGLPILARVGTAQSRRPKALILTPTRELAAQIRKDLAPYGKAARRQIIAVYGGVRYAAQIDWLDRGVDVLVATPGRLEDLLDQGALTLADVTIVAVDEADRMADMGFLPAVRRIIDQTAADRQTLLFSATLDGDVGKLVRRYQNDPVTVSAGPADADALDAEHHFWRVTHSEKVDLAASTIEATGNGIIFTRTRHGADRLARQIAKTGIRAAAIHGGLGQGRRNRALADFKAGAIDALVATDVAARGIHVDGVASVIHFDPPNGHKDYVHRSGRTARAGSTGTVVSLVKDGERRATIRMQRNLGLDVPIVEADPSRLPTAPGSRPAESRQEASVAAANLRDGGQRKDRRGGRGRSGKPAPTHRTPTRAEGGAAPATGVELVVSNLPWSTTDDDLRRLFGKHGKVHAASIKLDRRGRSKGVGIVRMHHASASNAVGSLDGRRLRGRPIKVRRGTGGS